MLCPRCYGTHVLVDHAQPRPCPDCGGWGEIHCCDGLTEQPDYDGEPGRPESVRPALAVAGTTAG